MIQAPQPRSFRTKLLQSKFVQLMIHKRFLPFSLFLAVCLIALLGYEVTRTISRSQIPPLPSPTNTPTPTLSPVPPSPTTSPVDTGYLPASWTTYPNNNFYVGNLHFYFNYLSNWAVNYRRDPTNQDPYDVRVLFDMLPSDAGVTPTSDFLGFGTMAIDVFPFQTSLQDWINSHLSAYSSKLTTKFVTIGNKAAYHIQLQDAVPTTDPAQTVFTPVDVVIGQNYIYEITFTSNSKPGSADRIKNEIWPRLHFD